MKTLKAVISENILALLRSKGLPDDQTGVAALKNKGMSQGTAQRLLDPDQDVRIGSVEQAAKLLGVAAWALLIDGIDPDNIPTSPESHTPWPLPLVDKDVFDALKPNDKAFVQGSMNEAIKERLKASQKQFAAKH